MPLQTTPAVIERSLTLGILRGQHPVGSRLPTVRALAEQHGVNPATIQRVVARLETRGLVTARQGSGLLVNDPALCGDLSLVPYWLEATLDQPQRAASVLADFLEVRRIIAVRLLVRHRDAILAQAPALADAASDMARAEGQGLDALIEADLHFARTLLKASGNVVALAVLNTMASVLHELPVVAEAMYSEPARNAASMLTVMQALLDGTADASERIERTIADVDEGTVARLRALLEGSAT